MGFTNDDFPSTVVSPAYHDLLVGLICFDFVYFSIAAVDKVHTLLGSQVFWQCVQDDIIQFVHMQHVPSALFVEGSLIGDVGLFSIADPTGKPETGRRYYSAKYTSGPRQRVDRRRTFIEPGKQGEVIR